MAYKVIPNAFPQLPVKSRALPASFEIQEVDSTARHRITILKGTTARYGIGDYFKYKVVVALKECFHFARVDESKQRRFYEQFCALKKALQAKSQPKIKEAYDGLIKIAHSCVPADPFCQKPYEEAVLSILQQELSEQTTKEVLHDILLHEGTKLIRYRDGSISIGNFIDSFDQAVVTNVRHNYGTKEEAQNAFIEAAIRVLSQEGNEEILENFVQTLEKAIEIFSIQNLSLRHVVEATLSGWASAIDGRLRTGIPITREGKIWAGGDCLQDHVANLEEFNQKLEQVCLKREDVALGRQIQELDQQKEKIQEKIDSGQRALLLPHRYNREEFLQFMGEGMKAKKSPEELKRWDSKIQELATTIYMLRQRKELLDRLPGIPAKIDQKEKELKALKQKHASSDQTFDILVERKEQNVNIRRQARSFEMEQDVEQYVMTSRELSRLKEDLRAAHVLDITQTNNEVDTLPQLEHELDQSKKAYLTAFFISQLETMDPFELTDNQLLSLSKVATGPRSDLQEALQRAQKGAADLNALKEELAQIQLQASDMKKRFEAAKQSAGPVFTKDDFPPEVVQKLTQQLHERSTADFQETQLKAVDIVQRIAAGKAEADLHAWEDTFRRLDPSLKQTYLASGRVIVRFNPDQLTTVRCQEIKGRLVTL